MDAPVVDRAVCESLFGVRRRRAIDLMRSFGGYQAGNTIRMLDEPEFEQEQQRKRRLSEHLAELEKHRRAAAVRISVDPEVVRLSPAHLPAGIAFQPGRLTVVYSSVEELLRRLYELAQAAANDFDQFSDLTGIPQTGAGKEPHPGHT